MLTVQITIPIENTRYVNHHNHCLKVVLVLPLGGAERAKDRENIPQTEVIVDLLGQLLLAQLVQSEELPSKGDVLDEAAAGKLHPDDQLPIGNHHGNVPELDLHVLRQLLPSLVGRVHGDEDAELGAHVDLVSVSEEEIFPLLLLAREYNSNLLSSHGEDLQKYTLSLAYEFCKVNILGSPFCTKLQNPTPTMHYRLRTTLE